FAQFLIDPLVRRSRFCFAGGPERFWGSSRSRRRVRALHYFSAEPPCLTPRVVRIVSGAGDPARGSDFPPINTIIRASVPPNLHKEIITRNVTGTQPASAGWRSYFKAAIAFWSHDHRY